MPAVSNTSPIFNLACINRLPLLPEQFSDVWIPQAVDDELRKIPDKLTRQTVEQGIQDGWLKTRMASNASLVSLLMAEIHLGEAEAIALALEMKAARVLIDERDGRLRAPSVGVTGNRCPRNLAASQDDRATSSRQA